MTIHKKCELCYRYTYAKGYEDAKEITRRDTLLEVAKMAKEKAKSEYYGGMPDRKFYYEDAYIKLSQELERMAEGK